MIETQFNSKIQIFKSDNGGEFFTQSLGKIFLEKRIVQISSCVDTPQQNGVAERKNRHLLEVTRALMFTSHGPKYLWDEALLTTTFLINRMPNKVLNFRTPRDVFLESFPNFKPISSTLPLRVFGCTVFVQNLDPSETKLDPKAIKSVLIGYSLLKKGYKCYHPPTRKIFTSLDLTFFEHDPYFSKAVAQGESTSDPSDLQPTHTQVSSSIPSTFLPCNQYLPPNTQSPIESSCPSPTPTTPINSQTTPTSPLQPLSKPFQVYTRKRRKIPETIL